MKKLFVGGLPWATTSEELGEMFKPFGEIVSATVITDKFSGRSKGFGFVEMAKDEESDAAMAKLNGSEMNGRSITVNEARPMKERGERSENSERAPEPKADQEA